MKTLSYIFVGLLAFYGSLLASEVWNVPSTLVEITANTNYYDGRLVEFETYVQIDPSDHGWIAGEQWEKLEAFVFLQLKEEPTQLYHQLAHNTSLSQYNRVKVVLRGRVKDNCKEETCCFGQVISLEEASFIQIGDIELYSRPIR